MPSGNSTQGSVILGRKSTHILPRRAAKKHSSSSGNPYSEKRPNHSPVLWQLWREGFAHHRVREGPVEGLPDIVCPAAEPDLFMGMFCLNDPWRDVMWMWISISVTKNKTKT